MDMARLETPNVTTIQALADFLNIPLGKTAKAVFFKGDSGRFVFAVIRGDLDVNETKLRKAAGELGLVPATVEEIRAIGAEPGYGSPVGVTRRVRSSSTRVSATRQISSLGRTSRLAPAKRQPRGATTRLTSWPISPPPRRASVPEVRRAVRADRAIEVGNIFKLGTRYSKQLGAEYLDAEGKSHPIVMGSYGIGSGRSAATIVEQHFDEKGSPGRSPLRHPGLAALPRFRRGRGRHRGRRQALRRPHRR